MPVCYRSGLLEHDDYVDIVATARPYLRGAVPPQQPVIVPPGFEHCWYEQRNGSYNLAYWLLLMLLLILILFTLDLLPNLLKEWDTPPPPFLTGWFCFFLIAGSVVLGLSWILVIVREYRALTAAMPLLLRAADRDGLHFYYRNGCIHSLAWQDIRDMRRVHISGNHSHDALDLHDRLGHCYRIDSLQIMQNYDYDLVLTETLDLFTAIRADKALPPLSASEITHVLLGERILFWINTPLACFFISAAIQRSLHMQTRLTVQFDVLFPFLFIAQGALNVIVPLFSLFIRHIHPAVIRIGDITQCKADLYLHDGFLQLVQGVGGVQVHSVVFIREAGGDGILQCGAGFQKLHHGKVEGMQVILLFLVHRAVLLPDNLLLQRLDALVLVSEDAGGSLGLGALLVQFLLHRLFFLDVTGAHVGNKIDDGVLVADGGFQFTNHDLLITGIQLTQLA